MDYLARIHKAIDYLKDSGRIHIQRDIVAAVNGNESNVTQALKGNPRYLTKPFLKRFAAAYSDYISEEWLLTGEGEMVKPDRDMRPHYDAKASAGFMDGISEGEYGDNLKPLIPFMRNYDFTIEVKGKSMFPEYRDGDVVACKISRDRLNPPVGEICVIDTKDGAVLKEIMDVEEDCIVLHSLNPEYKNYMVGFDDINRIAVVVGLVRSST
ncbi:MAG: S24 family peptidase [Muribaculaceae bacterium]|nr:S24 family peptidase [Muribaculaceae bacterium]